MIATESGRRVRKSARDTLWFATGSVRAFSDFGVIGAQKDRANSLHQYLVRHPRILPALKKAIRFFDDRAYENGLNRYRSRFPLVPEMLCRDVITREAGSFYVFHPRGHQRVVDVVPEVIVS